MIEKLFFALPINLLYALRASKRILDPIVKLQKRIITKSPFLAYTQPLFHDLNLSNTFANYCNCFKSNWNL